MIRIVVAVFFLSAFWLSHGQIWAIIEVKPHPPGVNHCVFVNFWSEVHQEACNEIGFLSLAEQLEGFEPVTF